MDLLSKGKLGIAWGLDDKIKISRRVADIGIGYIEGGWPGGNPKDTELFDELKDSFYFSADSIIARTSTIYEIVEQAYRAGYKNIFIDEIHKYGCPVFVQLLHVGPWLPPPYTAASSTLNEREIPITVQNFPNARALSVADIKDIVQKFGDTAVRAKKAGFDGIAQDPAYG
jgi:hypothetical protein